MNMDDAKAFIKKYDTNKDGKLDLDELSEALALAENAQTKHFALLPNAGLSRDEKVLHLVDPRD